MKRTCATQNYTRSLNEALPNDNVLGCGGGDGLVEGKFFAGRGSLDRPIVWGFAYCAGNDEKGERGKACSHAGLEIVETLLAKKVDVNKKDKK